jgi:DNA-binding protein HU-beta
MAKTTTSTAKRAAKAPASKRSTAPRPAAEIAGGSKAATTKAAAAKGSAAKPGGKRSAKTAAPAVITLRHLSAEVAERHDLPKKQADSMLAELFGSLVDHLKAGERVRIGGLGTIEVKDRPARMGRNPATGEAIQIKASKKLAFRPAKELKQAI